MSNTFASPLGPLHLSHPSQMTSFVVPLPSSASSRIRSFFRPSAKTASSSSKNDPPVPPKKAKKETLQVNFDDKSLRRGTTFTPLDDRETSPAPPPSYRQAIEEDLYCEDVMVAPESKEDRKRRELIEADKRMSDALRSYGF